MEQSNEVLIEYYFYLISFFLTNTVKFLWMFNVIMQNINNLIIYINII